MAKAYFDKLTRLVADLELAQAAALDLETRHFFSGAALYANASICASWSPVGLAFKLSKPEVAALITSGKAKPLQYFDKGPIKKDYALFADPQSLTTDSCKQYFLKAIDQVS